MKASLVTVLFLALIVAVFSSCDPDGNGKPESCDSASEGVISRNFWDPTRYWECESGSAISVQCPDETGYLASKKSCVPWSEWEWVPPCPESDD